MFLKGAMERLRSQSDTLSFTGLQIKAINQLLIDLMFGYISMECIKTKDTEPGPYLLCANKT